MAKRRDIEKNLAEKMQELKGGDELSEQGKKIQRRIHNSLNPFKEDIIDKEDQEKLIDFLQELLDGETDKSRKENIILISGILQEYFKEKEKSGSRFGK